MTLHVLSCIHHFESFTVATTIWSFLHHRVARVTPRMSQVEQELLTFRITCVHSPLPRRVRVARSSVKYFVNRCLSIFIWPLYCLTFFDLRILIISLVSSKLSCNPPNNQMKRIYKTLHRK